MTSTPILDPSFLTTFLAEHGPSLGLTPAKGKVGQLASCWAEHPAAVHELTGLYLAWTSLISLFLAPPDPDSASMVAAPRDWLDLSNATAPAVARCIEATRTCANAGHHVSPVQAASP